MKRTRLRIERLEDRRTPAIATWDGGGANNLWSTPANWAGDVAPNPGDDLVFAPAVLQLTNVNNFAPGTAFRSIQVNDDGYQISGNAITLAAGLAVTRSGSVLSFDVILAAAQTFSYGAGGGYTFAGGINLNGQVLTAFIEGGGPGGPFFPDFPGFVRFNGVIQGSGAIIKDGTQVLGLSGSNTFTGVIDHRAGSLFFSSNSAGGASGAGNETLVGPGAVLSVAGGLIVPEPITFADSTPNNQSQLVVGNDPVTFTGPLTLQGRSRWLGEIVLAGGLFGTGSLSVQGSLTFPAGSISTYTGALFPETQVFRFNGIGPVGPVFANDSRGVSGNGSIGPLTIQGGSRFAPGDNGIGTLTTGNLVEGAFYDLEIGPTGSDRVVVNGTVALAGTLNVIPSPGFTPTPGAVYRIIDNDGGDFVAGAFGNLPQGTEVTRINGVPLFINYRGGDGNDVELTTMPPPPIPGPRPFFAVGAGEAGAPIVTVYNEQRELVRAFFAYEESFRGGVHVAVADVTGDGIRDVVTAPGFGGGPVIRIWDGETGALANQYLAYDESFRGGVFIATAKIDTDSVNDIITGAGQTGGPHVKVFTGFSPNVLTQFLAYDPNFTGGVRVAGVDGFGEGGNFQQGIVVTGAGVGGGAHVRTWAGLGGGPIDSFFAYDLNFTGGVYVAAGRIPTLNGPPADSIVVSPGSGALPDVRIFDLSGSLRTSFLAYDPSFLGGVTIALRQSSGELITGAGPGGGPHVKRFSLPNVTLNSSFFPFDPAFTGGVYVG